MMDGLNELERHEFLFLEERFSQLIGWERAKKREHLVVSAFFYSVFVSFLLVPARRFLPAWVSPISLPAILFFVLAPAFLLLRRWRSHESLRSVYLMDKILGLEERAITGWEILCRKEKVAAERLVLREAGERLRDVDPRTLFKRRLTWQLFFTPLLFSFWLFFFWLDFGAHLEKNVKASQLDSTAQKLKDFSVSMQEKARSEGLTESLKLASRLEEVAEKNLKGEVSEKKLKENLAGMVNRIEGMGRGAQETYAPFFSGSTQKGLLDLKAELETLKPGLSQDDAKRERKLGAELLGRLSNLPRLREGFQAERIPIEEMGGDEIKNFLQELEKEVGQELDRRTLVEIQEFLHELLKEFGDKVAPAELQITSQAGQGELSKGEKIMAKGGPPGDEPGTKKDAHALPFFRGTALTHLKGLVGKGKSGSLAFSGESAGGKSTTFQEEVMTSYRRQAEEELSSEQIPEGLREAVKRYFLSLGIAGDRKGK